MANVIWHPRYEGHDHINVYSKSKLALGRALSNFFHSVFTHPVYGKFHSVEGFYFYLLTGQCHEELRTLYGYPAKALGEAFKQEVKINQKFKDKIKEAIAYKIIQNPYIQELLVASNLPLTHYYYYGDPQTDNIKFIDCMKEHGYMIRAIEEIRHNLKTNGKIT